MFIAAGSKKDSKRIAAENALKRLGVPFPPPQPPSDEDDDSDYSRDQGDFQGDFQQQQGLQGDTAQLPPGQRPQTMVRSTVSMPL